MSKSKVVVLKVDSYDQDEVDKAIQRGIELLGGIEQFVKPDEKILLKPNFLTAKKPDEAVTTHPAIFSSVIGILKGKGYEHIFYGDSPGFGSAKNTAKVAGFKEIADKNNVTLAEFDHGQTVSFPEGNLVKSFDVAQGVLDTDAIISLSKLKSHALTRLTGAIKNQFGIIYGMNKSAYHAKFPDLMDFSRALIDINRLVKPRLFIMDGIVAMEGNGPKNGDPVKMNVILMSDDAAALDTVAATLVDLEPDFIPTIRAAKETGFGETNINNIEILGDDLESLINRDFKVERLPAKGEAPGLGKLKYVKNFITRKPVVNKEKCISCGVCEKHCPQNPKAITLEGESNKPKYHYNRCIRCFCCQELCPNNAIEVKTPLIGKLFFYK